MIVINIRPFIPIYITAPYISTNVSTPRALWKVIKCEVLFWISSGSFWMKYNTLCEVKKIHSSVWFSPSSFSPQRRIFRVGKRRHWHVKPETKSSYRTFQKIFCDLDVILLMFVYTVFIWDIALLWYMAENTYSKEMTLLWFTFFLSIFQI